MSYVRRSPNGCEPVENGAGGRADRSRHEGLFAAVYAALLVVALATVDCAEVPSIGIRRSGSSFVQLVFESAGRPVRLRAASRWGMAMTALFDPTMRAVIEQLYQSERPWLVGSSKFERAFGSGAKPQQQAVPATVARFRDYVGR